MAERQTTFTLEHRLHRRMAILTDPKHRRRQCGHDISYHAGCVVCVLHLIEADNQALWERQSAQLIERAASAEIPTTRKAG